jgi:hypothetical protein
MVRDIHLQLHKVRAKPAICLTCKLETEKGEYRKTGSSTNEGPDYLLAPQEETISVIK